MKNYLFTLSLLACFALAFPSVSRGSLVITFQETANDGVEVSWSGNGTYNRPDSNNGTGDELDFNNFGSPFGTNIGSDSNFNFATPLILTGTVLSTGQPFENTYDQINLSNQDNNGDDIDIIDVAGGQGSDVSLVNGDTFTASGSSTITGLLFSDLVADSYFTDSGVETEAFGGVTLNIIALTPVPEPTSLLLFGSVLTPLALRRKRRRL